MREIETDYLVVGAGASGMAFTDTLIAQSDADVVLVDRRHRPGGHWLDAYPFVRLHQPSANYGVASRPLGRDRIDDFGPNAGFYERAGAAEICDHFGRALDEVLLPSGRVRFLGRTDYRGEDGGRHHLVSLVTGAETAIKVRKKIVDATYVESSIPSRHRPDFEVGAGVTMIPPNDLVDLDRPLSDVTVIGAGKTAMDTCTWLLDAGVDPERIRWIRPRDSWMFERTYMQPLDLVARYMQMQAHWIEVAAEAEDGHDFAHRLEERGVFVRIDRTVEADLFRGATISLGELESLRTIRRVVRKGKVRRLDADRVWLDGGEERAAPDELFIDCTAAGVRAVEPRPLFEAGRVTLEYVTVGFVPWSAATVAAVEAGRSDADEKNRLCPPVVFSGGIGDVLRLAYAATSGLVARTREPDLTAWNAGCRLNPNRGAEKHLDDTRVADAFASMMTNTGRALRNLKQRSTASAAPLHAGS
ncbi:MAG TPA: NAD(P)-binding protein [Candidatus Udaeobacter sp.]|nr:NAD(P)-binding protein [Candidatus Udaeobacter sp.]